MMHSIVTVNMYRAVKTVSTQNTRRVDPTVSTAVRVVIRPENSAANLSRRFFR